MNVFGIHVTGEMVVFTILLLFLMVDTLRRKENTEGR